MPSLTQLANGNSDPTQVNLVQSSPVVEPLDGPSAIDHVFDRFPEEVYQQGRDSHLYRLLSALGGDAGAGYIKTQLYSTRLQYEAEFLNFTILNQIYTTQFRFNRLKSETYFAILGEDVNPETDALTPEQWNAIELADQSYRQRAMEFWTALRYGNSPMGLLTMAQAATGLQCEVVENYKWIFDQMSDDPLGLTPLGTTSSVNEFVITPRFLNSSIAALFEFTQAYPYTYAVVPASISGRPATGTPPSVTWSVSTISESALLPEIEHNAIDLIDRLKPTGTLSSIKVDTTRYIEIPLADEDAYASSHRIHANRLVTGQDGVPWPDVDQTRAYFIEKGVEKEAGYFYGSARELAVIFLTIENVHAYTEQALADATYLTSDFLTGSVSPFQTYESEHFGNYSAEMTALYPFLNGLNQAISYTAEKAIAPQNTQLMLEARAL